MMIDNIRVVLIIAIISLISAAITLLVGWFTRKKRMVKYLPAILTALPVIYCFIKSRYFSVEFESLEYIIFALIAGVAFLASIVTALVLEFFWRRRDTL